MKKLIIWLAKVFDVNIVKEKIVEKEIVIFKYLTNGTIEGDVVVKGDLVVSGSITASGSLTMYKEV